MNEVWCRGGKAKEREIAEQAVAFCLKKLLSRYSTLEISVKFTDCTAYGYCMQESKKEYELEIRKGLGLWDLVSTICHEMIHVKQYARGEMRFDEKTGATMWKTARISDNVKYFDQPWEKEAYRQERQLALECFTNLTVTM